MILKAKYDDLDLKFSMGPGVNIVECPNCKEKNTFEEGSVDYNIKDNNSKLISKESAEHYAKYRCKCFHCKIDFCTKCLIIPYHLGKSCEQFKNFVSSIRCRYDNVVIGVDNKGPDLDVCSNEDCVVKFKDSCPKILKCGHKCFGCKDETTCPPCLNKDCASFENIYDQDFDTYCNICFTEGLGNAPIVLLSCKHFLHYRCLETRLSKKWIGPKITFNHCLCPCCNSWIDCPSVPSIQKLIDENKKLYNKICDMAEKRLGFEGLDKDPRLTDPNSKWYNKKVEFAMNRLCYYMCYLCKNPYFAGRRECGDGPNVNNEDPNNDFDPKDLVCGRHGEMADVQGITNCKIHGKDFIEYKCKFCCKIASWYCWGTTHFCDNCHKRQCRGDYVSKYPKEKLPKCNKETCEVGGNHPPNGTEYSLGCSVCRNTLENIKNF